MANKQTHTFIYRHTVAQYYNTTHIKNIYVYIYSYTYLHISSRLTETTMTTQTVCGKRYFEARILGENGDEILICISHTAMEERRKNIQR